MIIGFAGPKRSGKDYAYNIIKNYFTNENVERVAFADPIKQKICEIFNLSLNDLEELKTQSQLQILCEKCGEYGNFTGRDLITGIGMLMRGYDEHQFERYVSDIVKSNPDKFYICTDVRFQSEVELIHSLGGFVVQLYRNGVEYEGTETESGISDYDYALSNDAFFKDNIIKLIEHILSKELLNVYSRKNIRV